MRLFKNYRLLGAKILALLTSFEAFLKAYINALLRQSLIPYIDLSWARDPSLRAFDML